MWPILKYGEFKIHSEYREKLTSMISIIAAFAFIHLSAVFLPSVFPQTFPSFLALHTLLEIFSIVISMMVFLVGWNSPWASASRNIVIISCAFLATAILDLLHTVSYAGMPDFITQNSTQKQLTFWMAARLVSSFALLIVAFSDWAPRATTKTRVWGVFWALMIPTIVAIEAFSFGLNLVPELFVEGQGLTLTKKALEFVVVLLTSIFVVGMIRQLNKPQRFDPVTLIGAGAILGIGEIFFAIYTIVAAGNNLLGHLFKLIGYIYIYRAIVVEVIVQPYRELEESQKKLSVTLTASNTGLWSWDPNTDKVSVSPEWTNLLGYTKDQISYETSSELLGHLIHPADAGSISRTMTDIIKSPDKHFEFEVRMRHKDGHYRHLLGKGEKKYLSDGRVDQLVGTTVDITDRHQIEEKVRRLANFDILTGLPNRQLFNDRAEQAISIASRNKMKVAFLFLDLDNFKNINDTLGHHLGDKLLIEVSKRLVTVVRKSDTVARMGGDEFVIMLQNTNHSQAAGVARDIIDTLKERFMISGRDITVSASIGIAIFDDDGRDFGTLYQHADTAMYHSKRSGKNKYSFFSQSMQDEANRNLRLENMLRYSLSENQLSLVYQPKLDLNSGQIIGAEALLRWHHPTDGNISPTEFIPIAENSGQIAKIGEWVLETAARQLREWCEKGYHIDIMAVNLSMGQLRDPLLHKRIENILQASCVPTDKIEVELTESMAMDPNTRAIEIIQNLHNSGLHISIDDFGTGYSSLSALKKFRINTIKIDKSFVNDLTTDEDDRAIVKSIIEMAHNLKFSVVAEGVETKEQLEILREFGCELAQGYYISKPLKPEDFEVFLKSFKPTCFSCKSRGLDDVSCEIAPLLVDQVRPSEG